MIITGNALDLLRRIALARSTDPRKPNLSSVAVQPAPDGRVSIVACDGFILAAATLDLGDVGDLPPDGAMIPDALVKVILRKAKPATAVTFQGGAWSVASPLGIMSAPATSGSYPQWRKVLPAAASVTAPTGAMPLLPVERLATLTAILSADPRYPRCLPSVACQAGGQYIVEDDGIICAVMANGDAEDAHALSRTLDTLCGL